MMTIKNYEYKTLKEDDLFVCVLGYEPRSYYLLEENIGTRNNENTLVFKLDNSEKIRKLSLDIIEKGILLNDVNYNNSIEVERLVNSFLRKNVHANKEVTIYIDYSSMPRSWYCALPIFLSKYVDEDNKLFFLYTAGEYPHKYKNYPTAGIDSISVFAGITLPAVDIKRYHIIGLGYDKIRTETVKSIIEPDLLITCYAYNPDDYNMKRNVYRVNEDIIKSSLLSVAFPISNFSGMINKLCELVYDQTRDGQVIIIPDGPKPLIMAMSLVPELVKRDGVTCLHISRNCSLHCEIPVIPRIKEIFAFQVLNK